MAQTTEVIKGKVNSGYIFILKPQRFPMAWIWDVRWGEGSKGDFKLVGQAIKRMGLSLTEMGKAVSLKEVEFQVFNLGHVGFEIPFRHQRCLRH